MVKISNIDEFENIIKSNFGFVVINNNESQIMHKTKCLEIRKDDFFDAENKKIEYHWFSSVSLSEKKFAQIKNCEKCNMD